MRIFRKTFRKKIFLLFSLGLLWSRELRLELSFRLVTEGARMCLMYFDKFRLIDFKGNKTASWEGSSILWSLIKTPSSARSQVSVKLEPKKVQLYEVKDFSLHTIVMHTLTKAYRFSRFMGSSTPKTWNEIKFHLNFVSPGS